MLLSNRNLVEPSGWPSVFVSLNLRSKAGFDGRKKCISTAIKRHAKKYHLLFLTFEKENKTAED